VTPTSTQSPERAALLAFGREMIGLSQSLGFDPVVYGSLAYLAHTGDQGAVIADIDLLVGKAAFPRLIAGIADDPTLRCEPTTYNSLKVFHGDLKLSFDSLEDYLAGVPFERQPVEIDGYAFVVVDRHALIEVYRRGASTIDAKRLAYLGKIAGLGG